MRSRPSASVTTREFGHLVLLASCIFYAHDIRTLLAPQSELPCLTPEGRLIMETRGRVAMAPDGNGGVYTAMDRCRLCCCGSPLHPPR